MCGIGEKVDRRPIDPPPVVQVKSSSIINENTDKNATTLLSTLFLITLLVPAHFNEDEDQLDISLHSRLTVGRTVSSLYNLRDLDGVDGYFFVFSDISIRAEGSYRLKMCLFDITEDTANYKTHVLTNPFTVYSAKTFPGMYRSYPLVQNFAKQGLKIRVRKEAGPRMTKCRNSNKNEIQKTCKSKQEDEAICLSSNNTIPSSTETTQFLLTNKNNLIIKSYKYTAGIDESDKDISAILNEMPNKRRLSLSYLLDQDNSTKTPRNEKIHPPSIPQITCPHYTHQENNRVSNSMEYSLYH